MPAELEGCAGSRRTFCRSTRLPARSGRGPGPALRPGVTTLEQRVAAKVAELAGGRSGGGRSPAVPVLAAYRGRRRGRVCCPNQTACGAGRRRTRWPASTSGLLLGCGRRWARRHRGRRSPGRCCSGGSGRCWRGARRPVPVPSERVLYRIAAELDRGGTRVRGGDDQAHDGEPAGPAVHRRRRDAPGAAGAHRHQHGGHHVPLRRRGDPAGRVDHRGGRGDPEHRRGGDRAEHEGRRRGRRAGPDAWCPSRCGRGGPSRCCSPTRRCRSSGC